MANILVVYYSAFGHIFKLAQSARDGAQSIGGSEVELRRVAELEQARAAFSKQEPYRKAQEAQAQVKEAALDDLRWADGIIWGTPTRYGNMAAQMKQFIDSTGRLWVEGALEDKPTGILVSTGTIHGGQETTVITSLVPLLHLGMIFVGTPYGQNPQIRVTDGIGGSPYGPGTLAGEDGSRQPVESELTTARNLGIRVARVAELLKGMRNRK